MVTVRMANVLMFVGINIHVCYILNVFTSSTADALIVIK